MGYFYILVTIAMALGSWWAGSKAWEEFSTGDLLGSTLLQDGAAPEQIKVQLHFKGDLVAETSPGTDGSYRMSVKTGAYSISFQANGYQKEIRYLSIQSGETPVEKVALNVIPKPVGIQLVDKRDNPYTNIKMNLSKKGSFGTMNQSIAELDFDNSGQSKTPQIEFGDYAIILISPIDGERKFLWVDGKSQDSYPGFRLMAQDDSYKIVLPKVVFSEHSGPNSAPTYTPIRDRFFAQSFRIDRKLEICGIGFGIGIGGNGVPTSLQIRRDSAQKPSPEVVVEVNTNKFSASLSNVRSGSYGNCVNNVPVSLEAGNYWVVAKYDILPERISLLGGPDNSTTGYPMKSSSNGTAWNDFSFENIKKLDFFLTE